MLIIELPLPDLPMLIIEPPLPDLPMLIIELPLPDLPEGSGADPGSELIPIPPKGREREKSADIDTSSMRARTRLPLLRPQKIPWAPTVSVAIAAKRKVKMLDTRMVLMVTLLVEHNTEDAVNCGDVGFFMMRD
jgi:hypothetical protein